MSAKIIVSFLKDWFPVSGCLYSIVKASKLFQAIPLSDLGISHLGGNPIQPSKSTGQCIDLVKGYPAPRR